MREFDFNILHEQQNTHKESTQTDLKGIVNLEVNLYKGLKYNGFIVTPLLITPRLIGQQKKVPMSPRYAAIILVRERKKILSRPPFRTEVYIMKRITSNALL